MLLPLLFLRENIIEFFSFRLDTLQNTRPSFTASFNNLKSCGQLVFKYGGTLLIVGTLSFRQNLAKCEGLKLSHKSRISKSKIEEASIRKKDGLSTDASFDWKLFMKLLLPDLWLFTLASLTAFAVALVNIRLPHLIGELINAITSLTHGDQDDINAFDVLYKPSVKLIINYGLQSCLTFLYITLLSSFGERFAARMRVSLFKSLVNQDVAFFDAHKTGEIVNR